ncbi:MAG: hypothetical protein HY290_08680 [Planctomycetia bacterium]|nr:hypothetical protein [Planctomycetia bacterium]
MRAISAILIALVPTVACCNEMRFSSYAFGKTYVTHLTSEDLAKTPEWSEDTDNPPLPARKAITLADKMRAKLVKDEKGWNWRRVSASIQFEDDPKRAMWAITYEWSDGNPLAGMPHRLRVFVLMDGTVLEPTVSLKKL